jgi:integrase
VNKDLGFNAHVRVYDTKNGQPRGVPLNKQAMAALVSIEPDPARRIGMVFKRSNGEHWGAIRTAFERVLRRAGIENSGSMTCDIRRPVISPCEGVR